MNKTNLLFRQWIAAIVVITAIPLLQSVSQTDYPLSLTFSVSQTGINRFIAGQWNDASFTKSWSGNNNGLSYSIQLQRPSILLSNNTIKIVLGISYQADDGGMHLSGTVIVTPTLTIPPTTINASDIIAQYTDLHQQILAITQFTDSRLKDAIEQALSPIEWIMYKGKVMETSTTRLSSTSDIAAKALPTVTFSVTGQELLLTISETITATQPWYNLYSKSGQNNNMRIRIESNVSFTNIKIKTTGVGGGFAWNDPNTYSSSYDATTGIYYLEIQTNQNYCDGYSAAGNGICRWAFKRGNTEVIRAYKKMISDCSSTWKQWDQYVVGSGSYGY